MVGGAGSGAQSFGGDGGGEGGMVAKAGNAGDAGATSAAGAPPFVHDDTVCTLDISTLDDCNLE
jgi:hypothetical protein